MKAKATRKLIVNTRDWREVLSYDKKECDKQRYIQHDYRASKKIYLDKELVLREALPKAEEIISGLLTEEKNTRLSRGNRIIWGKKNGSVHFHLNGAKEGVVNDFERGIHGDLITFYAKSRGLDWYDGLSELASALGFTSGGNPRKITSLSKEAQDKKEKAIYAENKLRVKVRQLAQTTWDEAKAIPGTIVETYLKKHRGADFDVSTMDVRFHPAAPVYKTSDGKLDVFSRKAAMIVRFQNEASELTAVQCTYLDPQTANKDKGAKIAKITVGSQWGSAGLIYCGGDEKVIVAEGAETAMSLIQSAPKSSVYITGGNMQNIQHYEHLAIKHGKNEIHIAADNDLTKEAGSWRSTEVGARRLSETGIRPLVSLPESIKGNKTDFNDVYKRYGSSEVKKQFVPKYTIYVDSDTKETTTLKLIGQMKETVVKTMDVEEYRIPDLNSQKNKSLEKDKGGEI